MVTLTQLAVDTFHRANAATLGANWSLDTTPDPALNILNNQCVTDPGLLFGAEIYSAVTPGDDQYVGFTIEACVDIAAGVFGYFRADGGLYGGYVVGLSGPLGAGANLSLSWFIAPDQYGVLANLFLPVNVGDEVIGGAIGSTVFIMLNGKVIFAVKDSHATSGVTGLLLECDTTQSDTIVSQFVTGNVTGSAPTTRGTRSK